MSKGKEEGKEKEKMKGDIIAVALNASELNSFDNIYGNLVKEPGKSLTDEEVIKLGDEYLTSEKMLHLFSKHPEEAYKELIAAYKFDDGMFIKLIVYEEICSTGKFTFNNMEYLMHLAKNGSFNLKDPMLLAYAVRLGDQDLALQVTKELVKKGAVIADNILFHSYNNPYVMKFLLMEKLSIITYQDKFMGTDSVIKKLQHKISTSGIPDTAKKQLIKTKELLEIAKVAIKEEDKELNIKLDIMYPPAFDNKASKALFEHYSAAYEQCGIAGVMLYTSDSNAFLTRMIEDGGNLKGLSKEFENYVRESSMNRAPSTPQILELLFKTPTSQDAPSTSSTTSVSTTSSLKKSFSSSSSSSTSKLQTTTSALPTTAWILGSDPIDEESTSPTVTTSSTVKTITTSCPSTLLFSPLDPLIPTTESINSTGLVGDNFIEEFT